ncbi:MAG: DUF58 domain-containing protein [Elainellaceae cyanobacterium]
MPIPERVADWLETHWVAPAYSGWVMAGLALFFFAAATNTMAGWLYVISGVMLALLAIASILPERILRGIQICRLPIQPVSVGDVINVEIHLENQLPAAKTLIQVTDETSLGESPRQAIELIPAHETYRWVYQQPAQHRGIYRWQTVSLKTAAPLGLFWCRRSQVIPAKAVVYPTVLPLGQCPLVDQMGQDSSDQASNHYLSHMATEGLTRSLRPYRWGDPIRLVHWRTSARYGELRVRDLETHQGEQEVIIALDSAIAWNPDCFEQAVVAAASLYFYALKQNRLVSVWTATTGRVRGDRAVLETLAATQFGEQRIADRPNTAIVWLSQNVDGLPGLPPGSRWLLWQPAINAHTMLEAALPVQPSGLVIQPVDSLESQLQTPLK